MIRRPAINTFGTRLYVARLVSGFNRSELAAETGIPAQRISAWETGENEPKDRTTVSRALALVLDVDLEWLLEGPDRDELLEVAS